MSTTVLDNPRPRGLTGPRLSRRAVNWSAVGVTALAAVAFAVVSSTGLGAAWSAALGTAGVLLAVAAAGLWIVGAVRYRPADPAEREQLLAHALRVETVGAMAGMVAHELRNRLQIVVADAALAGREDRGPQQRRLRRIRDEVARCEGLLDHLLGVAHPESGEPSVTDLAALCGRSCDNARVLLPACIDLRVDLPDAPLFVDLDSEGFEHALLNLVINARHAMPGAGELSVSVRQVGARVEVRVADTGVGIEPEHLPRVFEPYFTTRPRGLGTGLGLAAVARFVRRAGGAVTVQSEVGVGTEFCLAFPLCAPSAGQVDRSA